MTLGGWLFMLGSWTAIIGLFVFCMVRTLSPGQSTVFSKKSPASNSSIDDGASLKE
ncbi:MAG: hypothetical protein JXA82_14600 [Sedimentisphaerales bacterium]|nr:hypothetical protein [Sedimentisphaerales bacterium]